MTCARARTHTHTHTHKNNHPVTIFKITIFLAVTFLGLSVIFFIPGHAVATGGAFTSTKHGGGTTDGITPFGGGVNRGVNPDYSATGVYNTVNPEAGQYQAGECAHCHEPHASFGGSEPPPNASPDSGPKPYLLMKNYGDSTTNYSSICWYCHENMTLNGQTPGYGYWAFYQGQNNYTASSHYTNNFVWPGTTGDSVSIWPRQSRSSLATGNKGSCVNCHTPHGVKGNFDTETAMSTGNYNVAWRYPSISLIPRQLIAREEALCLNCHDGSPAATDIYTQVNKWGFLAPTQWNGNHGSGHPVREDTYYDRHNLANESNAKAGAGTIAAGWFTAGSKHAECPDCHNPHLAQGRGAGMSSPFYGNVFQGSQGDTWGNPISWSPNRYTTPADSTSSAVLVGYPNIGVWGVSVTASSGQIAGTIASLSRANQNFVYNLCLKCHSYWAWNGSNDNTPVGGAQGNLWNSPSSKFSGTNFSDGAYTDMVPRTDLSMTNQSWEFATDRVAYHPVFGTGKHRPELYTADFASGTRNPCWCAGLTCKDTNTDYLPVSQGGLGQGAYGNGTCTDNGGTGPAAGTRADLTGADVATLSQNFVPPWRHTSKITCVDCHEDNKDTTPRGPHGSDRPYILRKLDTTIRYTRQNNPLAPDFAYFNTNINGPGLDTNNFCLNCHRADVYGWGVGIETASMAPPYGFAKFARQPHNAIDGKNIFRADLSPNGIVCMNCHGGSRKRLGRIHGSDYLRLIPTDNSGNDAAEWTWWSKGTVLSKGSCGKTQCSPYCGETTAGGMGGTTMYNY